MCPSAGKRKTTSPLLYLSTWFPRLIIRLKEGDLRGGMLSHKHAEQIDNATETRKGKQEQRQQQCHCCYICQHRGRAQTSEKACCTAVSHTYFGKLVGRKSKLHLSIEFRSNALKPVVFRTLLCVSHILTHMTRIGELI